MYGIVCDTNTNNKNNNNYSKSFRLSFCLQCADRAFFAVVSLSLSLIHSLTCNALPPIIHSELYSGSLFISVHFFPLFRVIVVGAGGGGAVAVVVIKFINAV